MNYPNTSPIYALRNALGDGSILVSDVLSALAAECEDLTADAEEDGDEARAAAWTEVTSMLEDAEEEAKRGEAS